MEGFPIPTYHCDCGQDTEGFIICLKCNPQTYTIRTGHPPTLPYWKALCMTDEEIKEFNNRYIHEEEMSEPDDTRTKYRIAEALERDIWNEAIEAAASKLEEFVYYKPGANEIRKLKK